MNTLNAQGQEVEFYTYDYLYSEWIILSLKQLVDYTSDVSSLMASVVGTEEWFQAKDLKNIIFFIKEKPFTIDHVLEYGLNYYELRTVNLMR